MVWGWKAKLKKISSIKRLVLFVHGHPCFRYFLFKSIWFFLYGFSNFFKWRSIVPIQSHWWYMFVVYTYGIFTKIPITDRKCVKILLRMYSNQGGFRSYKESKADRINNFCIPESFNTNISQQLFTT